MTVLAVDDEESDLKLIRALLRSGGYQSVSTADSGKTGLELLKDLQPDLILQDITMPGMDGFEFCRHVRAHESGRRIPIIVMTGLPQDDIIEECVDAGATDFVSKPINRVEFLSRIRSALTLKQSFDRLEEELILRKQTEERIRQQSLLLKKAYSELELIHQRLNLEYEIAGEVFSRVAPADYSKFPNIRTATAPVSTVGGDVLMVAPKPSGGLNVLLGDFTGHGLSAAIGAIPVSDIFHRMSGEDYSLSEIIFEINRKLKAILPTGLFLCACFLALDDGHNTLTVWNGGLPDALLVGAKGGIKLRFPSDNLPLGLVNSEQLDVQGRMVNVTSGDLVYVISDGIIEARNLSGELYGQERFERNFHPDSVHHESLFDTVFDDFVTFQGQSVPTDDYILTEVQCGIPVASNLTAGKGRRSISPGWQMSMELGPDQLRSDPLQYVLNIIMEAWELRRHREDIYLILAELYSNALDYGVLGLNPAQKKTVDGFIEYVELRQKTLETLNTGWIRIDLQFLPGLDESKLVFRAEDSGPGFDHLSAGECTVAEEGTCGGRGIKLVRSLCKSLVYNDKGNCAEAVYVW